ncbi:MAG: hypothetical protein KDB01_08915 [Planctomycetaceae bacterium]|nr:hypothetical protein [Planctomycetaceae bacterium]
MIPLIFWRVLHSHAAILQLVLTTTIAATMSADSVVAQQVLSNVPNHLLSIQQDFRCEHVIDLMIRNRMRQQNGAVGAELAPGLVLAAPPSANQLGDLELLDVHLVLDGSPTLGPVIQVALRNNSLVPVSNFQISIVGVLGQIHRQCPTVRGLVSQVAAGAVSQFQLQLPSAAMAIGMPGRQSAPFDTIIVAIDSFDEFMEGNELNNLRIIRRCDLLPIPVAPVEVSATITQPTPSGLDTSAAKLPVDRTLPSTAQPESPLDSLMLEDNQLETTQPTASGMAALFSTAM